MPALAATPNQEALWQAHGQGPAGAGNLHWRLALGGQVDAARLRRAWTALCQRHEALRTGFAWHGGTLMQEVCATAPCPLGLVAWDEDDDELSERAGRQLHDRRFDLRRPPLVRALLFRAGGRQELHVCGHRTVVDEACWPLLLGDLAAAYEALAEPGAPTFEEHAVPFRVFATEERDALAGGAWRASVDHSRACLTEAPPVTLVPSAGGGWRGDFGTAVLRVELSPAATGAVRSLVERGVSPLAVHLAALQAVLGRAAAGAPCVVGVGTPNRRTVRDRSIVGPLANTVPVAGRVDEAASLRTLVARAQASDAEVRAHGHVPLPVVLAALDPESRRRVGAGPAIVLLERVDQVAPALGGVSPRPVPGTASGAGVGVQVAVCRVGTGFAVDVEYRTALFDRRTAAVLVSDLDRVLAMMAEQPDARVGALPVRTRAAAATVPAVMSASAAAGASAGVVTPGEERRESVVTLRAAARPHVHLFHPGGAGSAVYQPLAAALPASWTVTASEDVGNAETIEGLAERYLEDLLSRMEPPDVLGGWSMGGVLAYEAVRRLCGTRRAGRPALLLVDSPPPIGYGQAPSRWRAVPEFAESLWRSLSLNAFRIVEVDVGRDEEAAMCALAASLWRSGEEARPDWLLARLDEYHRHRRAVVRYTCADRVGVPALAIVAELDEPHLEEWRRRLAPGAAVVRLAGGHFDVLRPPLVAEVARLLTSLVGRIPLPPEGEGQGGGMGEDVTTDGCAGPGCISSDPPPQPCPAWGRERKGRGVPTSGPSAWR